MAGEKNKVQEQLDQYRETGVAYFNPEEELVFDGRPGRSKVKDDWEEVPRAPKGSKEGGQWIKKFFSPTEFLHGTDIDNVKSIMENGLLESKMDIHEDYIFATTDKKVAHTYGQKRASGEFKPAYQISENTPDDKYAIIVFRDPKEANPKKKISSWNMFAAKHDRSTYVWEKTIAPEFLKRIEIYSVKGELLKVFNQRSKVKNELDDEFYAVAIFPKGDYRLISFSSEIKNDWSEVERVPAGQPGGGRWTDGSTTMSKEEIEVEIKKIINGVAYLDGMTSKESQAVLEVIKEETQNGREISSAGMKFLVKNLNTHTLGQYFFPYRELNIDINQIRESYNENTDITSYEDQIKMVELALDLKDKNWRMTDDNDPQFIDLRNKLADIQRKKESGEPILKWTVAMEFDKPDDKLKAIVYHELGHVVSYNRWAKEYYKDESEMHRLRVGNIETWLNKKLGIESVKYPISNYAKTNSGEYFAEAYALYNMGKGDRLGKNTLRFIKSFDE